MDACMSHYREIVIETYGGAREYSTEAPPARPLAGQGLDTSLKVECSGSMRRNHPIGTKFLVHAKLTDSHGTPFLYSSYRWKWRVVKDDEIASLITTMAIKNK